MTEKETIEEGIKEFDENKRRLLLLDNDFNKMRDKVSDGLDQLLQQKMEEIRKLGDKLMKFEDNDNAETKALDLKLDDARKLKKKLGDGVDMLAKRVKKADTDVGYD